MDEIKLTSISEHLDRAFGKKGTPERDAMEARLKKEVEARPNSK